MSAPASLPAAACPSAWRGEWLSLAEFSSLIGKSYEATRWMLYRSSPASIPGIEIVRCLGSGGSNGRTWLRIDAEVYNSLL